MIEPAQIFTFLFLMLGPFKIVVPFAQITKDSDAKFARKLAFRAILFSLAALAIAALLGNTVLSRFGIPLPILAMAGGLILFLVALLNIIRQFSPDAKEENESSPTSYMAIIPLAFPNIVTPHGIAAVIVFLAISPDLHAKLVIGAILLGIMLVNLVFMLLTRSLIKVFAIILPILGAILGVIQVALGLHIIYNQVIALIALN